MSAAHPRGTPEFEALLDLSAQIGADPALVQAAGGNTSLKRDGLMWIKASGTWLAEARERDIMVPVRLEALRAALGRDDPACESAQDFVAAELNPGGLRPSIETTMHAVLPQPVVVHVHCVETIAHAIARDAEKRLAPLLEGLGWAFVPYARPGLPLTRAIDAKLRDGVEVLVLGNHGLVVAADTVGRAEWLLDAVRERLRHVVRQAPVADIGRLVDIAVGTPYVPAEHDELHAVAVEAPRLAVARSGSLYPDHVIFLGPGIVELGDGETIEELEIRLGETPPLVLVPGAGALIRKDASPGARALARCLGDVLARVAPGTEVVTLTTRDDDALVSWDAEKYRQALERGRG